MGVRQSRACAESRFDYLNHLPIFTVSLLSRRVIQRIGVNLLINDNTKLSTDAHSPRPPFDLFMWMGRNREDTFTARYDAFPYDI